MMLHQKNKVFRFYDVVFMVFSGTIQQLALKTAETIHGLLRNQSQGELVVCLNHMIVRTSEMGSTGKSRWPFFNLDRGQNKFKEKMPMWLFLNLTS
jgi:hypothetical protein